MKLHVRRYSFPPIRIKGRPVPSSTHDVNRTENPTITSVVVLPSMDVVRPAFLCRFGVFFSAHRSQSVGAVGPYTQVRLLGRHTVAYTRPCARRTVDNERRAHARLEPRYQPGPTYTHTRARGVAVKILRPHVCARVCVPLK